MRRQVTCEMTVTRWEIWQVGLQKEGNYFLYRIEYGQPLDMSGILRDELCFSLLVSAGGVLASNDVVYSNSHIYWGVDNMYVLPSNDVVYSNWHMY